ncbi:MAG: ATP-binding protein [Planctomycetes bacterium]|nr:ATP-binding protein [Planctomycetota bacterium]
MNSSMCRRSCRAISAMAVTTCILSTLLSMRACCDWLRGGEAPAPPPVPEAPTCDDPCLSDVRGQAHAKRALLIAAAGGHNLLMLGPPGSGKTMLARRLPGILPPLASEEALETTRVNSINHLEMTFYP